MANHPVMHVQYSNGINIWQCVLKPVMNTLDVYGNSVKNDVLRAERKLKGSVKEPNILIYFFFSTHHSMVFISDVQFTGGRGVSDFSVVKYY